MKYTHTYPARIDAGVYQDLLRIKDLDNRSINSLLQEGARKVRDDYIHQLTQQRKMQNTLQSHHSAAGW